MNIWSASVPPPCRSLSTYSQVLGGHRRRWCNYYSAHSTNLSAIHHIQQLIFKAYWPYELKTITKWPPDAFRYLIRIYFAKRIDRFLYRLFAFLDEQFQFVNVRPIIVKLLDVLSKIYFKIFEILDF